MAKILIFCSEILPNLDLPCAGLGLRAWVIGEALKKYNHQVCYSIPQQALEIIPNPSEEIFAIAHTRQSINQIIKQVQPDLVYFEQWPLADAFSEDISIPMVIDLPGPVILESSYQPGFSLEENFETKIRALRKGDFFLCANSRQKAYYLAWLMLAGIKPEPKYLEIMPICMPPEFPKRTFEAQNSFVFSGVFWPWQDPFPALKKLISILEQEQKGQLTIIGGRHPLWFTFPGDYPDPYKNLPVSSRYQISEPKPFEDLIKILLEHNIAIDLMSENYERYLGSSIRTIVYLWCGLPPIIGNYSELATLIDKHQAGWAIDPEDTEGFEKLLHSLLNQPEQIIHIAQNAQKLAFEKFNSETAIKPLLAFINQPFKREKSKNPIQELVSKNHRLTVELDENRAEVERLKQCLNIIENKKVFRWYRKLKSFIKT